MGAEIKKNENLINGRERVILIPKRIQELTCINIVRILKKMRKREWAYVLGNSNPPDPCNLLVSVIPVPPMLIRPTVDMMGEKTNEDDLSIKLFELLNQKKNLK